MADWTKHRESRDFYRIDYAAAVANGEVITSFEAEVYARNGLLMTNRTAEFLGTPATLDGTVVTILLEYAAEEDHQQPGEYVIIGKAVSTQGREPVAVVELEVTGNGSDGG